MRFLVITLMLLGFSTCINANDEINPPMVYKAERIELGYKLDEFSPTKEKKVKKKRKLTKEEIEEKEIEEKYRMKVAEVKKFFNDFGAVFLALVFVVVCVSFSMMILGGLCLFSAIIQREIGKRKRRKRIVQEH